MERRVGRGVGGGGVVYRVGAGCAGVMQGWYRATWLSVGGGGASAGVDLVGEFSFFRFVPTFGEDASAPSRSPLCKYGLRSGF